MNTKILIATGLYPPESGGPATYAKLLEEYLPTRGFGVRVLPFRDVRSLPKALRHLAYFLRCLRLARGTDIIYAQDTVSVGLPTALAALVAGKKFMVRVPGDYAWEQGRQRFGIKDELDAFQKKSYGLRVGFLRVVQHFVVRRAWAVVVPSEYMKKIVGGWGVKKIEVIYSSISLPVEYRLPQKRPEGFLIVTAARLVPWKGIDRLIEVIKKRPEWTLVVVGDGPERGRLESLGGDKTFFTGALPHAEAMGWIKSANVFVLNSTYEGLSYLLIEAMSLRTAVIATNVGGNPEVIKTGMNGILLFVPGDNKELVHAIETIQTHPEQAEIYAEAGSKRIEEKFSADAAVSLLIQLFNTL